MKPEPRVSIIIPVYNAERYIAECIEGIISQHSHNWELILINDGSTDKSCEICRNYAEKDERIQLISVENGGPSRARNIGLDHASGQWISFIDADDYVDAGFLSVIDDAPLSDMIYFGFRELREGRKEVFKICSESYDASDRIDSTLLDLFASKAAFYGFTWNKFYRRSIIESNNLRFNESLFIKEDEEFIIRYCRYIKSLWISSKTPYVYRILATSLSHKSLGFRNIGLLADTIESDLDNYPWTEFAIFLYGVIVKYQELSLYEARCSSERWDRVKRTYDFCRNHQKNIPGNRPIVKLLSSRCGKTINRWMLFFYTSKTYARIYAMYRRLKSLLPTSLYNRAYRLLKRKPVQKLTGENLCLGENISVVGNGSFSIDKGVFIQHHSSFCFNPINNNTPQIEIGNGVSLGKYNDFGCSERIVIEDYVITAPFVHITDRDHCFEDIDTPIMHQPTRVKGPVIVGSGSWLGFGVQIMSGVRIGKNCVIAAGAIVTKDIPDYCVAGGNPAKLLKRYNHDTKQWEKV